MYMLYFVTWSGFDGYEGTEYLYLFNNYEYLMIKSDTNKNRIGMDNQHHKHWVIIFTSNLHLTKNYCGLNKLNLEKNAVIYI